MHDALRLAGRARRVEDEQWIFGVHFLARAIGWNLHQLFVQPDIAARRHCDFVAGAADNENLQVTRTCGPCQASAASVFFFSGNGLAAAQALIGGDDELGIGVFDAVEEAVG